MSEAGSRENRVSPVKSDAAGEAYRGKLGDLPENVRAHRRLMRGRKGRSSARGSRARWVTFSIIAGCLALIALAVLDAPVGAYRKQWPAELIGFARAVTDIGQTHWYLVPSGLFMIVVLALDWNRLSRRRRWLLANWYTLAGYVFVTIAASGLIATALKRIIGRARPKHFEEHGLLAFDTFAVDADFASFPSGHATAIGALAAIFALLFPHLRIIVLILAIALGSTRILVGAHYPSDVIAGLAFGMWFAYFVALVFAVRGFIFTAGPGPLPVVRPAFSRFIAATPLRFLASVSFLQRILRKSR